MRRLQIEREREGMTKSALARRTDPPMNASTIGQIESGYIGRPYTSQLQRIAVALGFEGNPEELLEEVGQGSRNAVS